jgi:iron complex outermembrane receptor protein
LERRFGSARLTSITAWRYWNWDPSNDRDFLGLPITTISANPSKQRQFTQEVRYITPITSTMTFAGGLFAFHQSINSDGRQEQGSAAARWLLAPSAAAAAPGLLDGYGQLADIRSSATAGALFGQLEWQVGSRVTLIPGLRVNHDRKALDYDSQVYGACRRRIRSWWHSSGRYSRRRPAARTSTTPTSPGSSRPRFGSTTPTMPTAPCRPRSSRSA